MPAHRPCSESLSAGYDDHHPEATHLSPLDAFHSRTTFSDACLRHA